MALTGIILSFCGMEIATVHTGNVDNPQKAYPKAMLIATAVIFFTLICGALAIAIVIPEQKISLVAGIMQAFSAFFTAYHMDWILPLIAVMLVIGGMGGVNNWIIAPTRGLLIAAEDGNMPKYLASENRSGAPQRLLIYQAVIVWFITLVFVLFPTVNAAYWLLTALASQFYMLMYLLMFAAGIRLRYLSHNSRPGFRLPGQWGMWLVAGAGMLGSTITFCIGFIPPSNIQFGGTTHYELLLLAGLIVMSVPPFIMHRMIRRRGDGKGNNALPRSSS